MDIDSVPDTLRSVPQWVCWTTRQRGSKSTKVPIDPQTGAFASTTDPTTWTTFDDATRTASSSDTLAGVGFVFTDDDPFVGIDLDNARDPDTGRPEPWAKDLITTLDSYTEVSPSGTGYHVYVRGSLSSARNRAGDVECYEHSRFFTVTGQHVGGTPRSIYERPRELRRITEEYLEPDDVESTSARTVSESGRVLSDDDLLERARRAKNGEKFERLWRGDTSGYDSHSEADMALVSLLAFWTAGDIAWMDALFRQSGLFREKWDERHYADGETYGARTLQRAVALTDDYYEPVGDDQRPPANSVPADHVETRLASVDGRLQTLEERVAMIDTLQATVHSLDKEVARIRSENSDLSAQLADKRMRLARLRARLDELESTSTSTWRTRFFG
ncbi:hypothetical protein GCM10009037_17250 [Halarchaeum grantii]|uniref:NrS-1 polymerase-like HBD domain-containing protein n=1 Tax=Halarchaeum grantii TaxID=1193105 RepID=A0A830EVA8_9EURY|nr:hypothetical protein [Halarchaeum grantii]GGL34186.1 hypothetical protein GCM10009037_17250 [Halarchaeum grantii]